MTKDKDPNICEVPRELLFDLLSHSFELSALKRMEMMNPDYRERYGTTLHQMTDTQKRTKKIVATFGDKCYLP